MEEGRGREGRYVGRGTEKLMFPRWVPPPERIEGVVGSGQGPPISEEERNEGDGETR